MKLREFKAIVKMIRHIRKQNGQHIAYLYVEKPATKNDINAEVEPRNIFSIVVDSHKINLLNLLSEGDQVILSVWLNSKVFITRQGWENYSLSMRLSNLKIINS